MIRGVIFDIDGTLLDSMPIWEDLSSRCLRRHGIEPEPGLSRAMFTMTMREGVRYIKERYHMLETEESIYQECMDDARHFYQFEAQLKPGAWELLQELKKKNIRMVLATSGNRELQGMAMTRLHTTSFFDAVLVCEEEHTDKNSPDIYLKGAEIMHAETNEAIVCEDAYHGIHSAHEAGFKVCAVEDLSDYEDRDKIMAEADAYITNLSELNKYLTLWNK